jgi:hypothetical protein
MAGWICFIIISYNPPSHMIYENCGDGEIGDWEDY